MKRLQKHIAKTKFCYRCNKIVFYTTVADGQKTFSGCSKTEYMDSNSFCKNQ